MRTKVTVTKSNIRHGEKRQMSSCPIALAVRRAFKANLVTALPISGIHVDGHFYRTSVKVAKFMRDFDNGKPVKPFSFWLR